MDSNLLNEVKRYKEILNLSEQEIVNEDTSKFSDDEYMLLGMISDFLSQPPPKDIDFIKNIRIPAGRFGQKLFDYLHKEGEKYNEGEFRKFFNVFSNEEIYNGDKPSDDNFVEHGKSMTNFKYSN